MRTKVFILAVVGVLALVGYLAYRSFNIEKGELAGENKILKADAVRVKADYDAYRKQAKAMDAEQEKIIAASNAKIDNLSGAVATKNKEISALKVEQTAIRDCPDLVANLEAQVAAYEENVGILSAIITEKDVIIAARDAQILDLRTSLDLADKKYNAEYALRLNTEAMNTDLAHKLGWARFGSSLKTVVIVSEAVLAGYLLLKANK